MQKTGDGEGAEGDRGAVARRQGDPEDVPEPAKENMLDTFRFEIC